MLFWRFTLAKTEFSIKLGRVLDNLSKIDKSLVTKAKEGVGRAMLQLKTDMIMQRPTAPIDEGFLRGSTSIFLQNKPLETPPVSGEKTEHKVTNYTIKIEKTQIIGIIGVNVPYAARHHEVPASFKEPSAGNKYLESKMSSNKFIYKKIIINTMNER